MLLMSQAEYAAHRGVGKPAVSNWKKAGHLVFAQDPVTGRMMVDVVRSDAKVNGRVDPMRGRPSAAAAAPIAAAAAGDGALPLEPAPAAGPSLVDARFELMSEQRVGAALKNAQLARELVPLVECERRLMEAGRLVRERVQASFRGLAERLSVEQDPRSIMSILEAEFDLLFAGLADEIDGGALDDDDDGDDAGDGAGELRDAA